MSIKATKGYTTGEGFASDVLSTLKKSRLSLKKETALVFYLYVPSKAAARDAALQLQAAGLTAEVERAASGSLKWLCLGKKKLVPEKKALGTIGNLLLRLAKKHKGQLDGWETEREGFDVMALFEELLKNAQDAVKTLGPATRRRRS